MEMRTLWYETARKRSRAGSSSNASRAIVAGVQRCRRGCSNRWCFGIFRKALASGCGERRPGSIKSQTAPRSQTPFKREAEATTDRDSLGRPVQVWLPYRTLDLPTGGRGDCPEVSCGVSPGSHRENAPSLGLDMPAARTTGSRSGRFGHGTLAPQGLAADKKGAQRSGSPLIFLDESGFMLQPVRRRTWAPSGQTPIQRAWDRHDRLSAVGLISVSPSRHRLSLYFHLLPENIDTFHMVWFLRVLHHHYRHHVVLVWDRWNVHKSATTYFEKHHPRWFTFEPLPSHTPELNPVEQCWNHTKYSDLANFIPKDLDHLQKAVHTSITEQGQNQHLLRSFFAYAKLPL
jgi:transposase